MRQTNLTALDGRIQELVTYARARDGEDRTALYRNLIDLFLTGKAPTKEPTRTQLLDVIEALLPHVDQDTRRTVAELLINIAKPPMDLIMRIVTDNALIVTELLRKAPFDEDQAIAVIESTGRAHHQELATRNDLSANVWISLARAAPSIESTKDASNALWSGDLGIAKKTATVTELHPAKYSISNLLSEDAKQELISPVDAPLEEPVSENKIDSLRILSDEEPSSIKDALNQDAPAGLRLFTAETEVPMFEEDDNASDDLDSFKAEPEPLFSESSEEFKPEMIEEPKVARSETAIADPIMTSALDNKPVRDRKSVV